MDNQSKKISDLIIQRKSIRTYKDSVLPDEKIKQLEELIEDINKTGPFKNKIRYELLILDSEEIIALNKLINYGFIKGSPAFIAGIMKEKKRSLEDFGYLMEDLILQVVGLGLDTCWLGGSLNKTAFLDKLKLENKESLPAVFSIGFNSKKKRIFDNVIRTTLKGDGRKPWNSIFFMEKINRPLKREDCGLYLEPLEMVRLAPSASNKQPWRIIKDETYNNFHFFFVRDKIYSELLKLRKLSDLQRMDLGIAIAHFELTVIELGLKGEWKVLEKQLQNQLPNFEYCVSWIG